MNHLIGSPWGCNLIRLSWLWGSLALLLLSLGGIFPGIGLASHFADSDGLSAAYVHLLKASQWSMAFALFAGGTGIGIWTSATKRFRRPWTGELPIRLPLIIALSGFLGAWLVQWGFFDNIPHITDATSHWFQSHIFATGHLSARTPPCLHSFFQHNVIMGAQGQWHAKYFPGQALWMVWPLRILAMPLAFAIFLASAHRVVSHYFEHTVANVAMTLLAFSPLMLLLSASFMSHITLLMWMSLCWVFLLMAMHPARTFKIVGLASGSGFCGGMAVLTRPQDAVLVGIFILCMAMPRLWRQKETVLKIGLGGFGGMLFPLLFLLLWNRDLYGQMLVSGYDFSEATPLSKTPIIHDTIGFSLSFTWVRALLQSFWVGLRLNQALLGWPAALPLLIPALFLPSVRRQNWVCLLGAAWLYLPYFFFHYYGFELEARYVATAAPFLVLMIARMLVSCFRALSPSGGMRGALMAWIAAFFLYSAIYYWPVYLFPRYSGSYEEASPNIHRSAQSAGLETPAMVLLPNEGFIYSSGFIHNDPKLQAPILYARDIPAEIFCLRETFPGRRIYRYQPRTGNLDHGVFLPIEGALGEGMMRAPGIEF